MDRIEIFLDNGKVLVVEAPDSLDTKEVYIGIEDEDGNALQDIAVIGEHHTFKKIKAEKEEGVAVYFARIPVPGKYFIKYFEDKKGEQNTIYIDGVSEN